MHRNKIMSAAFCGSPINILPRKSIDDVGEGGVKEPPAPAG